MKKYRTSEVAEMMGIHPNTVRFYEKWGLITKPVREENGYQYLDAQDMFVSPEKKTLEWEDVFPFFYLMAAFEGIE